MITRKHHPAEWVHDACIEPTADQNNLWLVFFNSGWNNFTENWLVGGPTAAGGQGDIYVVISALRGPNFGAKTGIRGVISVLVDRKKKYGIWVVKSFLRNFWEIRKGVPECRFHGARRSRLLRFFRVPIFSKDGRQSELCYWKCKSPCLYFL